MIVNRIVIIGAGGHGRVVADIARACGYKEIIFLDDAETLLATGKVSDYKKYKADSDFIIAIGNNVVREKIQNQLLKENCEVISLIHPSSVIGSDVEIGIGTVVMAGTVINTGTRIGSGVIINTSSSVDHDCVIEDYVHISVGAHLAGTVIVGKQTMIGAGTTVINNKVICGKCILGAGSLITKNIDIEGVYIGVPAYRMPEEG